MRTDALALAISAAAVVAALFLLGRGSMRARSSPARAGQRRSGPPPW